MKMTACDKYLYTPALFTFSVYIIL